MKQELLDLIKAGRDREAGRCASGASQSDSATMTVNARSFIAEMKEYLGFSVDDAAMLRSLAPLVEPHLPAMADRFYEQIPNYPEASRVFTGGASQVARLKLALQEWARGLFAGVYDDAYAHERSRIGFRHVQIALPQRYVIAAISVVERFIRDLFDREIADANRRREAHHLEQCREIGRQTISVYL